jgi:hypothetical protein
MQIAATAMVLQKTGNGRVCGDSFDSHLTRRSRLAKDVSVRVRGRRGTATEVFAYAAEDE